jgi:CRISPR-associated endonuclease/helicase Cas3
MTYWAHSSKAADQRPDSREGWQRLAQHLEAVSDLAGDLAEKARPEDAGFAEHARLCGLLHDYGKYSDCFQRMLESGRGRCQHAIYGAMAAFRGPGLDSAQPVLPNLAFAIAGHHAGMPDYTGGGYSLAEKAKASCRDAKFLTEMSVLRERASTDSTKLRQALDDLASPSTAFNRSPISGHDLYTRMLFSCLVDADRLDSAAQRPEQAPLLAEERLGILLRYLEGLRDRSPEGALKTGRAEALRDCLAAAGDTNHHLFSLSVPTGGGKTLAAMAFALQRAALQPKRFRRVIVVIPYLSIIEQNAKVYAEVFGAKALLEHHSGSLVKLTKGTRQEDGRKEEFYRPETSNDEDEEQQFQETGRRNATENWDSPLIVTTSVRFFESLFSNRPRDLRRVHNLARSIVILDEVQTLPRRLLGPLLGMMKELSEDWGVAFVFSTATQPAFERPASSRSASKSDLRWPPGTLKEIVRDPQPLRAALRRAEIRWEIDTPVGWPEVAARALAAHQCLAIVNLKDHALALFAELSRLASEQGINAAGVFHLSTRMCPAHRLRVLERIRGRLADGLSCHVVSTQLVEAGVDVDFPLVLRALAPLDAIVQAAGRADREGRKTAEHGRPGGVVVVFLPEDHRMPPNEYKFAAGITESLAKQAILDGRDIQVDSAECMAKYFEGYYGASGADLGGELVALRQSLKFATLAEQFEMISDRTREVFVPDDDDAKTAIAALREARFLDKALRHSLQRHVVGLSPWEFERARGVIEELSPGSEVWIVADYAYYEALGLVFEPSVENFAL